MQKLLLQDPAKPIMVLAVVLFAAVLAGALAVGGDVPTSGVIAGSFLGLGWLLYRMQGLAKEIGVATALMGQAIGLTAAFQGHPWQIDTHMVYFALLACLIALRSIPAILMATVITAVHHLSLSFIMPALVFPSGEMAENLLRTVFHAVIVLMETAVLVVTVLILKHLDVAANQKTAELEESVLQSEKAQKGAEEARQLAEQMQEKAKADQSRTEELLREAKEAGKLREDAENERRAAQEQAEKVLQSTSQDQAVVALVQIGGQRLQRLVQPPARGAAGLPRAGRFIVEDIEAQDRAAGLGGSGQGGVVGKAQVPAEPADDGGV